jgi:hypothetical protein
LPWHSLRPRERSLYCPWRGTTDWMSNEFCYKSWCGSSIG